MEDQKLKEKTENERIVRILSKDIEGKTKIYPGLTKIKGISWAVSNAICKRLKIDRNKRIGSLTPKEVEEITKFVKNPNIPTYLVNRRSDPQTGEDRHLNGADLELQKEFDIKKLKKIKSYKGIRHLSGLPLRGQRTKSHFRKNRRRGSGIKSKKTPEK
jgi:small subunit ribosomal protein S13